MSQVLVAFATKNGSAEEVAAASAGSLRDSGCDVGLRRARDVTKPIAGWDLVVLGAPIHSRRWRREAHRFLKRHRNEFGRVPVAVFGMGPRSGDEGGWQRSRDQMNRALAQYGWLTAAAIAVFGGVGPPKRHVTNRRDLRDWNAIRGRAYAMAALASRKTAPDVALSLEFR